MQTQVFIIKTEYNETSGNWEATCQDYVGIVGEGDTKFFAMQHFAELMELASE